MFRTRTMGSVATPKTDTVFQSQTWENQTARFTAHWGRSGAVIAVHGEIDAANASPLADYVQRCTGSCEWLILDLSDLEFIGTAGFSALRTISTRCANDKMVWTVVPGLAVSRLLRVCDPDSRLPIVESVAAALANVQDSHRLLRSATQPG